MKRLFCLVVALCACSADPGYEPRRELRKNQQSEQAAEFRTSTRSIEAPRQTIVALQVCADRFASKLSGKSDMYTVLYDLEVTSSGATAKVKDSMIPGSELETCLTRVLERMAVPEDVASTSHVSPQSRLFVGVVQAAAAPIALLPIVLISGGITILVSVSIYVAAEVVEALRRRPKWERDCQDQITACLASDLADKRGSVFGSSRCLMCGEFCKKTKGTWPSTVEIGGVEVSCWY